MSIHATAIISPKAELGTDVTVGPYAVIDDDVQIGDGCQIGPHAHVSGNTSIGSGTVIHTGANIGDTPQDLHYDGAPTRTEIGSKCVLREYVTIHRGSTEGSKTAIGDGVLLMAFAHLGHNCLLGDGVVVGYVHNQVAPGLGKIGVLVALESTGDAGKLDELGRQLAMHVAAAQPQFLDVASVDAGALDREREVLAEQARESGKPEEIIEKMVEGRLRKFYEEVVLNEQTFVIDGETKVSKVVEAAAKEIGAPVALAGFVRFTLGEGIERREDDFADEVAKLAN